MEGGESRREVARDRKTLREEEGGEEEPQRLQFDENEQNEIEQRKKSKNVL